MIRIPVTGSARVLKLSLIAFLFSPVAPVMAQGSALEEVIVTAQKREESIQDVGIAITAFSGEQLDALGITDSTAMPSSPRACTFPATTQVIPSSLQSAARRKTISTPGGGAGCSVYR